MSELQSKNETNGDTHSTKDPSSEAPPPPPNEAEAEETTSASSLSSEETKSDGASSNSDSGRDQEVLQVSVGEEHTPSQATMDMAEGLKVEGNALLAGELHVDLFSWLNSAPASWYSAVASPFP